MKPEIPTSTDPSPAIPAPRDWFHHQAAQAERLDRLERRVRVLEAAARESGQPDATSTQADAQALEGRYTAPAGVVPPHVALNLRAIAEWVGVALAGGDVRRP